MRGWKTIILFIVCGFIAPIWATPLIYSHRGAAGLAPENTRFACLTALGIGVDVIDMDVVLTKDGVLVVHHDLALNPAITRSAQGQWLDEKKIYLRNLDFSALEQYDVGHLRPGTLYAMHYPDQCPIEGAHIPRLTDVLTLIKEKSYNQMHYQIELKTDGHHHFETSGTPEQLAEAVIQVLSAENVLDKTEIQSFDWRVLQAIHARAPSLKTSFLTFSTVFDPIGASSTAGLRFEDYHSIPAMIHALGGHVWSVYYRDLDTNKLAQAHALGIKVVVWTVDTEPEMKAMIDMNVDGIITNRPDRLRGVLAAYQQPVPRPW